MKKGTPRKGILQPAAQQWRDEITRKFGLANPRSRIPSPSLALRKSETMKAELNLRVKNQLADPGWNGGYP